MNQFQQDGDISRNDPEFRTTQNGGVFIEDSVVCAYGEDAFGEQVEDLTACSVSRQSGGDDHVGIQDDLQLVFRRLSRAAEMTASIWSMVIRSRLSSLAFARMRLSAA